MIAFRLLIFVFDAEEIIAHVLDEMTFYGATEEVAAENLKKVLRLEPDRGGEGPEVGAP